MNPPLLLILLQIKLLNFSQSAPTRQESRKYNSLLKFNDNKMMGGCATVAGWGARYDSLAYEKDPVTNKSAACLTDFSSTSPHKLA